MLFLSRASSVCVAQLSQQTTGAVAPWEAGQARRKERPRRGRRGGEKNDRGGAGWGERTQIADAERGPAW